MLRGKFPVSYLGKYTDFQFAVSIKLTFSLSPNISHWLNWWCQPARLKALNSNFKGDGELLTIGPIDTNHLESLNRMHKSGTEVYNLRRAMLDSYQKDTDVVLKYVNGLLSADTNFHEHDHQQRLLARFQQRMHRKRPGEIPGEGELAADMDPKRAKITIPTQRSLMSSQESIEY